MRASDVMYVVTVLINALNPPKKHASHSSAAIVTSSLGATGVTAPASARIIPQVTLPGDVTSRTGSVRSHGLYPFDQPREILHSVIFLGLPLTLISFKHTNIIDVHVFFVLF